MTLSHIAPDKNSERSQLIAQVVSFLALTAVFSAVPFALMFHAGSLSVGGAYGTALLMWCPGLAALATCRLYRIDTDSLGWSWQWRYLRWAYWLPLLYAVPVYVSVWLMVPGSSRYSAFASAQAAQWALPNAPHLATWLLAVPAMASVGVIAGLARALGEEIGWRGFLLPRLSRLGGYTAACAISGVIWASWHVPIILGADYHAAAPKLLTLICFSSTVLALSFVLGWLRLRSNSLWPAAVLHASHNLFIQRVLDAMTDPEGLATYFTTEFGIGLTLTLWVAAYWCWRRRPVVDLIKDR